MIRVVNGENCVVGAHVPRSDVVLEVAMKVLCLSHRVLPPRQSARAVEHLHPNQLEALALRAERREASARLKRDEKERARAPARARRDASAP